MKSIISIAAALLIGFGAGAQDVESGGISTSKTQQQIMSDLNEKSHIAVKIYPNPAVNYLVVEPELKTESGIIKIMDIAGNVKADLHLELGSNGLVLDTSQYRPGLYVLAYYDDNNNLLHVERFYKN